MSPIDSPATVPDAASPRLSLFEALLWTILVVVLLPISAVAALFTCWAVFGLVTMIPEFPSHLVADSASFIAGVLLLNATCWFGLVTMWRLCTRMMPHATEPVSALRPIVVWCGLAVGSVVSGCALVMFPADMRALQVLLAWPLLGAVPLSVAYEIRRRKDRAVARA